VHALHSEFISFNREESTWVDVIQPLDAPRYPLLPLFSYSASRYIMAARQTDRPGVR
jgi:hypothetical protein